MPFQVIFYFFYCSSAFSPIIFFLSLISLLKTLVSVKKISGEEFLLHLAEHEQKVNFHSFVQ